MKRSVLVFFISLLTYGSLWTQVIQVDPNLYSPQQLIEDILINSGCIQNIQITNSVSGDFGSQEKSFGYFSNNGGPFPFAEGIVM
ncbi:MAG: hypothetical protein HKM28_07250, partial [Flavobacteriaceae bacterium]|nr:hypothetical protein [Flavobacteriaceae bacterium]